MKEVTFSKIIGETGVFIDGDWVESKDQDVNGDVRLIQLADIGDGVFINKSNRFLTSGKAKELKCTFLKQGDLLIARMPDPLGRACIFPGLDMPCVTVVDVCIVRPDPKIANSSWLKFLINSYDFRNKINKYITGTTRQRISRGNLEKLSFNLPEIPDQLKIASILNKAELSIKQRQESIDLLHKLLKSIFFKMFGDPIKNEKGWDMGLLGDNSIKITDGEHLTPKLTQDGYHLIMAKDVLYDKIDFSQNNYVSEPDFIKFTNKCNPQNEDVLLVSRGATIGRCVVVNVDRPFCLMGSVILIKPNKNKLIGPFINYLFKNDSFFRKLIITSGSSAQQAIYIAGLKKIKIIVPPIELQNSFAKIVAKAEAIKQQFKSSLIKLENLYGSLSQKLLKDELDLSGMVLKYKEEYSSTDNDRTEPKPIDKEKITVEVTKKDKPEDKRYGDPFEVDEAAAKNQGKEFYKEWKKIHHKKSKSKLTWDKVSSQQVAEWIKEKYEGYHFSNEMLIRFLKDEYVVFPNYYSSEELKKYPQLNGVDDIKSFIFSAVSNENPFIKLEQHFYNAEKETFQLNVTEEDYKLIEPREAKERSGIYFSIAEQ